VRRVTLITKADCSLCDQAKAVLERVADDTAVQVETVSVDSEAGRALAERSGLLFPPRRAHRRRAVSLGPAIGAQAPTGARMLRRAEWRGGYDASRLTKVPRTAHTTGPDVEGLSATGGSR
jgi:thiol-disulfide isomerase/thioredoxin